MRGHIKFEILAHISPEDFKTIEYRQTTGLEFGRPPHEEAAVKCLQFLDWKLQGANCLPFSRTHEVLATIARRKGSSGSGTSPEGSCRASLALRVPGEGEGAFLLIKHLNNCMCVCMHGKG